MELGYDDAAKICLTHSFSIKDLNLYIGSIDVSEEDYREIERLLKSIKYDDYDRLIQLCDSIALPSGPVDLNTRMNDVEKRYGYYPKNKRKKAFELKKIF